MADEWSIDPDGPEGLAFELGVAPEDAREVLQMMRGDDDAAREVIRLAQRLDLTPYAVASAVLRTKDAREGASPPPPSAEDPAAKLEHLLRVMALPARVLAAGRRILVEVRQLRAHRTHLQARGTALLGRARAAEARVRELEPLCEGDKWSELQEAIGSEMRRANEAEARVKELEAMNEVVATSRESPGYYRCGGCGLPWAGDRTKDAYPAGSCPHCGGNQVAFEKVEPSTFVTGREGQAITVLPDGQRRTRSPDGPVSHAYDCDADPCTCGRVADSKTGVFALLDQGMEDMGDRAVRAGREPGDAAVGIVHAPGCDADPCTCGKVGSA